MLYQGKSVHAGLSDGIVRLVFDNQNESVNKFDQQTLLELNEAIDTISSTEGVTGLLISSGKSTFIVGADIMEFGPTFKKEPADIIEMVGKANSIFNKIEDLPFPTVSLINGTALGGGCELVLATDYRVCDTKGNIGLPEIKLGIYPGFGGTVRLPRLIGLDNAIDIIAAGKSLRADDALKQRLVDAVVANEKLDLAGEKILAQANAGKLDWQAVKNRKKSKLSLHNTEQMVTFQVTTGFIKSKSRGYPAPVEAVKTMQKAAGQGRDKALAIEAKGFAKLAKTPESKALIGLFLNDQLIKKKGKKFGKIAKDVNKAAVLGAGIMGGGIAYQSAYKNVPIVMKDIRQAGIDQGMGEATKLLSKLVKRGKIENARMAEILANINPTLSYGSEDFSDVDIVVEAVVEIPNVKKAVLADIEKVCKPGTVLTSNTSTISITSLAEGLEHPENFCGMHFFNPVHRMPLVEIIRGEKTSEETIATTVAYASKMGKTPIVVNDCPGFLVNRVLFPYFAGFQGLIRDGADYLTVDKTMERFGWPMGPAYLMDVVGMDTAYHAKEVMAEGYPDRMSDDFRTSLHVMYDAKRYGQKTNQGFYSYTTDKRGKPKKNIDPEVANMLAEVMDNGPQEFSDEEIIDRMMIPMIIETIRCFEEGIVDTVNEADMALIMGLGFPPFRGGALRYADHIGLATLCEKADKYAHLGKLYHPTDSMREMAAAGKTYYND